MMTYPKMMIISILQLCFVTVTGFQQKPVAGDLKITLAMFSGREDPQWVILAKSPAYNNVKWYLDQIIQKGLTFSSENMPARLGYKGFLVQEGTGPSRLIVGPDTIPLQQSLLKTAPGQVLFKGDREDIEKEIASGAITAQINGRKVRRFAPLYEPLLWQMERTRLCNNCYNYATMTRTDTFARPGTGSGHRFAELTGQAVKEAAEHDGLQVYVPPPGTGEVRRAPVGERHLVALVVRKGTEERRGDFHWYRLDRNPGVMPDPDGFWSHKPGRTHVTDRDSLGQKITDPRNAASNGYVFVTFMTATRDNPNIQGTLDCNKRLEREHQSSVD